MRIALVATCLADALFPGVAIATTLLLERLGHEVVFPPDQICCGQMHINTGYLKEAVPVVRHHVEVFERRRVRRGRGAVRVVRRLGAAPARDGRPPGRRHRPGEAGHRAGRPAPTSCPNCWWTCSG